MGEGEGDFSTGAAGSAADFRARFALYLGHVADHDHDHDHDHDP